MIVYYKNYNILWQVVLTGSSKFYVKFIRVIKCHNKIIKLHHAWREPGKWDR
jgi:hypothetical protein